jgi:hypothetical protein
MNYTVHWAVNDGRCGYPNIVADPGWSETECRSYKQAIREHAKQKGVRKILSISETNSRGKIRGRNYRDFLVVYTANGATEKELYIAGEVVQKTVRVFGS